MKKFIEISGTVVCLDDITTISKIKTGTSDTKDKYFEFTYRSYQGLTQSVSISETKGEYYFIDNNRIFIGTNSDIEELRNSILKTVVTNV